MTHSDPNAAVCFQCQYFQVGPPMSCAKLAGDWLTHVATQEPFCPIGKHRKAFAIPQGVRQFFRVAINGAVGIVTWALRLCRTTRDIAAERRMACDICEHRRRWFFIDFCGICKCWLGAKTRNANQACPAGRWKADKDATCVDLLKLPILNRVSSSCASCGKRSGG